MKILARTFFILNSQTFLAVFFAISWFLDFLIIFSEFWVVFLLFSWCSSTFWVTRGVFLWCFCNMDCLSCITLGLIFCRYLNGSSDCFSTTDEFMDLPRNVIYPMAGAARLCLKDLEKFSSSTRADDNEGSTTVHSTTTDGAKHEISASNTWWIVLIVLGIIIILSGSIWAVYKYWWAKKNSYIGAGTREEFRVLVNQNYTGPSNTPPPSLPGAFETVALEDSDEEKSMVVYKSQVPKKNKTPVVSEYNLRSKNIV